MIFGCFRDFKHSTQCVREHFLLGSSPNIMLLGYSYSTGKKVKLSHFFVGVTEPTLLCPSIVQVLSLFTQGVSVFRTATSPLLFDSFQCYVQYSVYPLVLASPANTSARISWIYNVYIYI